MASGARIGLVCFTLLAGWPAAGLTQGFEQGVGTGPSQELSTPPDRRRPAPVRKRLHVAKRGGPQAPAGSGQSPGLPSRPPG